MWNCPDCGTELEANPYYCPECGEFETGAHRKAEQDQEEGTSDAKVSAEHDIQQGGLDVGLDEMHLLWGILTLVALGTAIWRFWVGIGFLLSSWAGMGSYSVLRESENLSKRAAQMTAVAILILVLVSTSAALLHTSEISPRGSDSPVDEPPFLDEDMEEGSGVPRNVLRDFVYVSNTSAVVAEAEVLTQEDVDSLSNEDLLIVSKYLIDHIVVEEDVHLDSLTIRFYDIEDESTASAKVVWAPGGDSSHAGYVERGDYTKHEFRVQRFQER